MSVAGPCSVCGSTQHWTVIAGVVYESCDAGCAPLHGMGLCPPGCEGCLRVGYGVWEPPEEGGVDPVRAVRPGRPEEGLRQPPDGWLSSLWEGGVSDG